MIRRTLLFLLSCATLFAFSRVAAAEDSRPGFDGPAELPKIYVKTSVADTPAPGRVWKSQDTAAFQGALDKSACGDTIELSAGTTYSGIFELPAKHCDDAHWIVIRTSNAESGLPAECTRVTPCYAGVNSLSGRPPFPCSSTQHALARLAGIKGQTQIIRNSPGANHYRLEGLEIADTGANGDVGGYYHLIFLKQADHIIFDRCWIHGSPTGEDIKGVQFEAASYIAVVDSYISDIHSKISVYGADSATIGSLSGPGPVKIVNNFLEAAGANVLWGGGTSETNVSDIEFRHNHVFKPLTWWDVGPNFFGTKFAVKNLYETKASVRVLIEGNIFENTWKQSQKGTAILLYPKNQGGQCPNCFVSDVTFRFNIVRHAVNGMGISSTYASTCVGEAGNSTGHCQFLSGAIFNVSIHDNLLEDINVKKYAAGDCCTNGWIWSSASDQPTNWPHDIAIEHNTAFPTGAGIFYTLDGPEVQIEHFTFRNNLVGSGDYGFRAVPPGRGRPTCMSPGGAVELLEKCFGKTWIFTNNVIVQTNDKPKLPGDPYPATPHCGALARCEEFFPHDWKAVGFTDFHEGNGGNYHISASSRYHHAGSDGKDVGADMSALDAATKGVIP
jgi:hypothetical protein